MSKPDGAEGSGATPDPWGSAFSEAHDFADSVTPDMVGAVADEPPAGDAGSSVEAGTAGSSVAPQGASAGDVAVVEPAAAAPGTAVSTEVIPPAGDAAVPEVPEVEPVPFTFTVDDKEESIEGAMHLPGDGLYIPDAQVPHVKLVFSQAKTLDRQVREERAQRETENGLWNRLTTHTFKDAEGKEQTASGSAGLEALRIEAVSDKAALQTLLGTILNPAKFAQLVDYVKYDERGQQIPAHLTEETEGTWRPVLNQATYAEIVERAGFAVQKQRFAVEKQIAQMRQAPPPPEPTAQSFADGTISSLASQHALTALTPGDVKFLKQQFESWGTRPATAEERKVYGFPLVVRPEFLELMKDKNATRAEMATIAATSAANGAKTAVADGKATAFNAGMDKGRIPPKAPPKPPAAPSGTTPTGKFVPKPKTEPSRNDLWANVMSDALSVTG